VRDPRLFSVSAIAILKNSADRNRGVTMRCIGPETFVNSLNFSKATRKRMEYLEVADLVFDGSERIMRVGE
jgi:hypothetical protein